MDRELDQSISDLQSALERLRLAVDRRGNAHDEWELVQEVGPTSSASAPSAPNRHRVTISGPAPTRGSIAASFPACPVHCLDLCDRLADTAPLATAERAKRAWVAGCWAKAVLDGPAPTPVLSLRPTCYVVLQCSRLPAPSRFSSLSSFRAAVGPLEGSDTVCHSFASIAEARVYCAAAGVPFPATNQQ